MRRLHRASFLRDIGHLLTLRWSNSTLYEAALLKGTTEILFDTEFGERTLSEFDTNLSFWVFDSEADNCLEITASSHPTMKVWLVITACACVPKLHGEFHYQGRRFSDPIYSSKFSELRTHLVAKAEHQLYFNVKKSGHSKRTHFVQNQTLSNPDRILKQDFLSLI